ncbi:hypothetical protein LOZ66_003343 [Ophidiomyces ophidiicola]|nr:hypothetical protein LOZ66_003343 [Ophidiomyces ophidiicola]
MPYQNLPTSPSLYNASVQSQAFARHHSTVNPPLADQGIREQTPPLEKESGTNATSPISPASTESIKIEESRGIHVLPSQNNQQIRPKRSVSPIKKKTEVDFPHPENKWEPLPNDQLTESRLSGRNERWISANHSIPDNRNSIPPTLGVKPIIDTAETREAEKQAAHVGQVLFDAFNSLSETSTRQGLEASRWAVPAATERRVTPVNKISAPKTKQQTYRTASSQAVMNVDDTSGFMAVLRARSTQTLKKPEVGATMNNPPGSNKSIKAGHYQKTQIAVDTSQQAEDIVIPRKQGPGYPSTISKPSYMAPTGPPVEEDREHLDYFSSWGTPPPRSKPSRNFLQHNSTWCGITFSNELLLGAEVRRIVLSPIPEFLASPTKILSLTHGGRIESVQYLPQSKSAHVLFCNPAACKRYYDFYPNGIEVNRNGHKAVIFVDQYKEVDIISSRIQELLDLGATRVIRAVGTDTSISMKSMVDFVEGRNFKLEKIVDTFDASSKIRTVTFHLCSIDHAVRLRSNLIREDIWEQTNVQFGPDP